MSKNSSPSTRFWKLDAIRGTLVIGLVVFHLLFDLHETMGVALGRLLLLWEPVRIIGATAFLTLVGISLSISYRKRQDGFGMHALTRGVLLLCLGAIITIATLIYDPEHFVFFGVISLIGASVLLSFVAVHRPLLALIGGIIVIIEGALLSVSPQLPYALGFLATSPFLVQSFDYYPLMPWFGVVLIGIYLGHRLYPDADARSKDTAPAVMRPFCWTGRHALIIYLLHQPLLLLLLRLAQLA